jgi:hypothetical protein
MVQIDTPTVRTRRGIAALVLACISLLLSLIACGAAGLVATGTDFDPLPVQSRPEVASASQVEAIAHVTLPPGTVLLSAAHSNGLEAHLSAKFRMPRTELDAFVATANFAAAPTPGLRAIGAEHNVGGGNLWDPETATTVSGIDEQEPTADGTYRVAMFNLEAPDAVTVYLYASRG